MKSETHLKGLSQVRFVAFDFDGVFTDNTVYVNSAGVESVRCWRGDGIGLEMLRKLDVELAVISTETNSVVAERCKKLKIRCISGCNDKAMELSRLCKELGVSLGESCFVGNDVNDLAVLQIVGVPVITSDAHASLLSSDFLRLDLCGGNGAVREICEKISLAKTKI